MPEFKPPLYKPMDRSYHEPISQAPNPALIETPILPIDQLGETVPENDPQGRNIIQTTQAAIRGGAGTLQIVMTTSHQAAIGGRFKAMGAEVREALKEVALANDVKLRGVELPTSLKNLSGFDYQQNFFSEEARREGLEEVKDAIKFTADVMNGGGVDIVSWEFPRAVNDAKWNPKDKNGNRLFERHATDEQLAALIDKRTGRIQRVPKNEVISIPYQRKDGDFKAIEVSMGEPITKEQVQQFKWSDFEDWAKHNSTNNKKYKEDPTWRAENPKWKPAENPEDAGLIFARVQLEQQKKQTEGAAARDLEFAEAEVRKREAIMAELQQPNITADDKRDLERKKKDAEERYEQYRQAFYANNQGAKEIQQRIENFQTMEEYGLQKSAQTYAEAGIAALRQTEVSKTTKPLYVGPEIGWPDYYGSHPKEFVDLIEKSRKQMVNLLTKPVQVDLSGKPILDPRTGREMPNLYYDERLDAEAAGKKAQEHIKGLFDTSHMGMWLAHFKPITDPKTGTQETEDARLGRFNKWFVKNVEELADLTKKKKLVGGIQLVDSMSAAHGHLPPGQGIFPVIKTAEIFRDRKFEGFLVSEGHEEERFGTGRIRTKTWQKAGSPIGSGYYGAGAPLQWGQVQNGYFGKTYSPLFMFGSYAPSSDFKLWSEVPLE